MRTLLRTTTIIVIATSIIMVKPQRPAVNAVEIEKQPTEIAQKEVSDVQEANDTEKEQKPSKTKNNEREDITWRDNPNDCNTSTHWIAKEKPHKCIKKQIQPSQYRSYNSTNWIPQCKAWAKQAGITWTRSVESLLDHESDCDPNVWNKAGSGACGIPQALPCSKLPQGINTHPVDQLKWMDNYVKDRYGGWSQAWYFWKYVAPTHDLNGDGVADGANWY